ncbi:hypothetical protein LTS14_004629 [Recurvomyces mirabilis]|uniref:uncharacterized protein n=1 Tax=Recurvomyces mirabilis TaxID=574656 RepID=UPI002DDFACA0|nr:hypothetical protein LTS14_004629 [Recurvomyces mirabilis]
MSSLDPNTAYPSTEKGHTEEGLRPSHDSSTGLLRSGPRPLEPRIHQASVSQDQPYVARLEFEPQDDREPPPPRHPSRQMMRYGPPPGSEYGWDDREDRRQWQGRASYDYGASSRPQQDDYYADDRDRGYGSRPYRRAPSVREPPPSARGPAPTAAAMRQKQKNRRSILWEDSGDEEESDDETVARRRRKRESREGSPPMDLRLPFLKWMNGSVKGHFVATLGEFVGTTMFLFFAFAGTQVANAGAQTESNTTTNQSTGFSPIVLLYIGIAFGFSLMVNVWIFFRISGGLFNPAVTLAMVMVHAIDFVRAFLLLTAQLCGAIFSSYIVKVLFPTNFNVRTTLSTDTSLVAGVFIEAILTAELVFTIFMLAKEKHKATFMAPIGIGMALFVAELVGVYYTGGVGPAAGAIAAVGFYKFIKMLEYEIANPGQDEISEKRAAEAAASPKKETV